jgi:MFS family permease
VMLMSNCSLAMDARDYSFSDQTFVMEFHFCAMFLPGFYTGRLIKAYGSFKASLLGAVIFTMSAAVFASGTDNVNFYLGMILLGLAWNMSFSAGTVMLTDCYRASEAPDVQAVNDLILFSVAGVGSIISGLIYSAYGWGALVFSVSGMMVVNLALLLCATTIKKDEANDRERFQSLSERIAQYSSDQESLNLDTDVMRLSYAEKVRSISVA